MATDTYNPQYNQIQPFNLKKDGKSKTPNYTHLNPEAYASLEELTAKEPGYKQWGSLIDISKYIPSPGILEARQKAEKVWNFLANPQSIDFSRSVNWTEQPTLSSANTMLNYGHTSGGTISLNDILLPCNCVPKNLQEYMERLQNLMVPTKRSVTNQTPNAPSNNDYRAPYLALVWGANIRYPVVIKDIKWKETHWYKGIPTYITLSITLQQLPMPLKPNAFGKTGSELDKEFGSTLREKRKTRIEQIQQKMQAIYNRDGLFSALNPRMQQLQNELDKNLFLKRISDGTGNRYADFVLRLDVLKNLFGDDTRQSVTDARRQLNRAIVNIDNQLGKPEFFLGDLKKDLKVASDFYSELFPNVKPPNLSGLSKQSAGVATKDYYRRVFDAQQLQIKLRARAK